MDLPMTDGGENVLVVTDDFQYYIPNLAPAIRQVHQQQQQQQQQQLQPVSHHNAMAMGGHLPLPQVTQALLPQSNLHPHDIAGMRTSHVVPAGMDMGDGLQMLGNICMQTQQETMVVPRTLNTVVQSLPVQNCSYAQMPMNGTAIQTQQVNNTMVTQSKEHGYSRNDMTQPRDNLNYQSSETYKAALMIMNPEPVQDNVSISTYQLNNVNLNNVGNANILTSNMNMNVNPSGNLCTLNSVNMSSLPQAGEITIDNCQLMELRGQFNVGSEMDAFQKVFEEDKSQKKDKILMKKNEVGSIVATLEQNAAIVSKPRKKGSGRRAKLKSCHFCAKELVEPDKSVLFKIGEDGRSVFFDTCNRCLAIENANIAAERKEIPSEQSLPIRITVQAIPEIIHPVPQIKKNENVCEICQRQVEKITSVIAKIEEGKVTYKNACKECSFKPKKTEDLKEKKRKLKLKKKKLRLKKLKATAKSKDGQDDGVVMETTEDPVVTEDDDPKVVKTIGTQVEEDPYKWKCNSCKKMFASKNELQKHRRKNHRYYRLFQCDQCQNRIKIYSSTELVHCLTCGKHFDQTNYSPYTLSKQFYVKRTVQDLKCPICEKEFSSRRGVLEHQKIHTDIKPHLCNICGKTFRTLPPLRIHMRVHTGEKPYKCEMCGKCFRQSSALNMHIRHHTGETPYACPLCSKKFARRSQYTKHMESHTEKRFECSECQKKFPTEVRLRRHHRKHTDENPYRCHVCGMNYEENSAYRRHMQKHDAMNPYRCGLCGKQFGGRRGLVEHATVHQEGNEFKCGICSEEYFNKTELDTHIQTHFIEKPYKCPYCDLSFSTKSLMEHHTNFHSSKDFFDCKKCKKKFTKRVTLDMHMRRHDGAKPFKCYICGEAYLWSTTLDSHMKTHYDTV